VARDPRAHETVRESVLDRLLDDAPDQHRDPPVTRDELMRRVLAAVRRDLEWLHGTRLTWVDEDLAAAEQASRSIATFGLQDFSHENIGNADAQQRLRRAIEQAILVFEPRLARVKVTCEGGNQHDRALRFRIEAVLHVEPIRESVAFDTVMELNGQTEVHDAS
jgi:type VI secretion system protein ImpF